MLHRLEGITSDMKDEYKDSHANRVNIISQGNNTYTSSTLVGSLAAGEEYIKNNWSNTGKALHIKVCSIAKRSQDGGANFLVFLDGANSISCRSNANELQQAICQDSLLKMKVNFLERSCEWVANDVEKRCEIPGIVSHCPNTCAAPMSCTADSQMRFQLKDTNEYQGCSWVDRPSTRYRCKIEGVASTCRNTCASYL